MAPLLGKETSHPGNRPDVEECYGGSSQRQGAQAADGAVNVIIIFCESN